MPIRAVLFDLDGTLVDSNDQHVAAWDEAFRAAGYTFRRGMIHNQIGKGADGLVPALIPWADAELADALGEASGKIFKDKYLDAIRPFAGARQLLVRVHRAGQRIVLASSASMAEVEHYLDLLDAHDLVTATTSAHDVEHTKPAPDIFKAALAKLTPMTAGEAIVVGDTPYDIQAAKACGIPTIAVRSGRFPDISLFDAGAFALYDDVATLLAGYDSSPLAAQPDALHHRL
ncbi:HAD family hydrolase [Sphingosinicellaceae bacterium]|nr:HAD family hydrolase [Sphingosinicellaceae bacterium]